MDHSVNHLGNDLFRQFELGEHVSYLCVNSLSRNNVFLPHLNPRRITVEEPESLNTAITDGVFVPLSGDTHAVDNTERLFRYFIGMAVP